MGEKVGEKIVIIRVPKLDLTLYQIKSVDIRFV